MREYQARFPPGRGCSDQMLTDRRILEQKDTFRRLTISIFFDQKAAIDLLKDALEKFISLYANS